MFNDDTRPFGAIVVQQVKGVAIWANSVQNTNRIYRMAWQWAETLVEIRGSLADISGTTK